MRARLPASMATASRRRSSPNKDGLCLSWRRLNGAVKHHHVNQVARCDMALSVMQNDEAIGLGHGAEHTGALVAGGSDLQGPVVTT